VAPSGATTSNSTVWTALRAVWRNRDQIGDNCAPAVIHNLLTASPHSDHTSRPRNYNNRWDTQQERPSGLGRWACNPLAILANRRRISGQPGI